MKSLIKINSIQQIPAVYRNTPIGRFLEYHNLKRRFEDYTGAQLLIGMCMDNRKHLRIPANFSYIIRAGGANLRSSEFKVSYAIGVGGVRHIALIGHNHCGMSNLINRKDQFIQGLVANAGWTRARAEEHFFNYAPHFEIGNEVEFIQTEVRRLRQRYPKVMVAPMLYNVEDNAIYLIREKK